MPVHKVGSMWQWGKHGKKYKKKSDAAKQGAAAHAHGYRESTMDIAKTNRLLESVKRSLRESDEGHTAFDIAKLAGVSSSQLKDGMRMEISGLPFNIKDEGDGSVSLEAVDSDVAKDLFRLLKSKLHGKIVKRQGLTVDVFPAGTKFAGEAAAMGTRYTGMKDEASRPSEPVEWDVSEAEQATKEAVNTASDIAIWAEMAAHQMELLVKSGDVGDANIGHRQVQALQQADHHAGEALKSLYKVRTALANSKAK